MKILFQNWTSTTHYNVLESASSVSHLSSSQLEFKSLEITNTNLLLLIQEPFKHQHTLNYATSKPFATSALFQTGTLYLGAWHSMDLLKGIICTQLLGKKQFLRYQMQFSPLLTLPERTNPRASKFCLLFAVILESVILQMQLRIFSPPSLP